MLHDSALVRLGRRAPRIDARTLRLGTYLKAGQLPAIPSSLDNGAGIKNWGVLANDVLGDCTVAGILHLLMLWGKADGLYQSFADADAISLYSKLCGYVPGKPETDQGGVEIDILNAWRKAPIMGCELKSYVSVNPKNWALVKAAIDLFGALYMGLSLPTSAQNEDVWKDTGGTPGSWGGHCTVATGFADRATCLDDDTLTCVTWGAPKKMTRKWLATYCDELYAPLSPTWLGPDNKAPNGFDLAQLQADLALI